MKPEKIKILGIEIEGAYRKGREIKRKGRKQARLPRSKKHPISNIKAKNLRQLLWLLTDFKFAGIRTENIDFSILQEIIMKRLGVSQRKAYDLAKALHSIDFLY